MLLRQKQANGRFWKSWNSIPTTSLRMYLVGIVLKPQGLHGEIKIESISPDPARFKDLDTVFIQNENRYQAYSIVRCRLSNRFVFLRLKDVNSRNDAELLRGKELFIEKEDLLKPGEDEFFIHDLVGCSVTDENNQIIGEIDNVLQYSTNDVLMILDKDNNEILIPFIKDIVKKIDLQNKSIIIRLMEGMLD